MKKLFTLCMASLMSLVLMAQGYRYNNGTSVRSSHFRTERSAYPRGEYGHHGSWGSYSMYKDTYLGVRMGMAVANVTSDDPKLDGASAKVGLNIGLAGGVRLTQDAPLYLEGALCYIEKGGKGRANGAFKSFALNYLQVPLVMKYGIEVGECMSVQPFFGGYLACGVGGKVKDFSNKVVFSSFSDDYFQRFDGGIRLGCGFQYEMLYVEMNYDWGLTNICHDYFDKSRNGSFNLTVGVNF